MPNPREGILKIIYSIKEGGGITTNTSWLNWTLDEHGQIRVYYKKINKSEITIGDLIKEVIQNNE